IITGAGAGGGPHVKVFDGSTGAEVRSFYAYAPAFAGGGTVAAADLDGDGAAQIVTRPRSGVAHVQAVDGRSLAELQSFFAFDPAFQGGAFVAAGDADGDGRAEVIAAAGPGGAPHVRLFAADGSEDGSLLAFDGSFRGGARVAVAGGGLWAAAGP